VVCAVVMCGEWAAGWEGGGGAVGCRPPRAFGEKFEERERHRNVVAMRVIRLCHYFKSGRRGAGRWVSRGARLVAGGTATGHACVCLVVVRLWFAGSCMLFGGFIPWQRVSVAWFPPNNILRAPMVVRTLA
jgi:hypothetical protein